MAIIFSLFQFPGKIVYRSVQSRAPSVEFIKADRRAVTGIRPRFFFFLRFFFCLIVVILAYTRVPRENEFPRNKGNVIGRHADGEVRDGLR